MQSCTFRLIGLIVPLTAFTVSHAISKASELPLTLRHRVETAEETGRYHTLTRQESWDPAKTALIVCDMWDLHHCLNAVRREGEFAPRLEQVLRTARNQGVTIIHSPSSCMEFYEGHAARERAKAAPVAAHLPDQISDWCHRIPAEERGKYPIDQSDGGEDDAPSEHAEWVAKLTAMGRNPKSPWKSQIDVLTIDPERDYISDSGIEVWSILQSRGIDNVILTGVHTNMCVLGRPFGLRRMVAGGKNVVLMRDLTDTMYNPQAWPFVSHFTGTDLIIEHIEKFVCPTITSDQLIGGQPFVFKNDTRPHVVMLIGEDEYKTEETLPKFAAEHLGSDFRVSFVFADETDKHNFPGIEQIQDADVLLVSVRRRTPPREQLQYVRDHVAAGKPMIGIRTASHAFALRNSHPPDGFDAWPDFDPDVWGGHYTGHHANKIVSTLNVIDEQSEHPILKGVSHGEFTSNGSLYKVSPLAAGTTPLLIGRIEGHPPEPAAWTFTRNNAGRSFYTSLGHPDDFESPAFARLLINAIAWASCLEVRSDRVVSAKIPDAKLNWAPITIPDKTIAVTSSELKNNSQFSEPVIPLLQPEWFRCFVSMQRPKLAPHEDHIVYDIDCTGWTSTDVWLSGQRLIPCYPIMVIRNDWVIDGLNTLVIRTQSMKGSDRIRQDGVDMNVNRLAIEDPLEFVTKTLSLCGTWQHRVGDSPAWADIPLPAQFAAPTDAIYFVE
ncbi:MAG: isochorismatase family protein [Planctomycetaceae bacterium]|nr:isochorismatase family protein [Planctomycetaceae bacterium]